MKHQPRNRRRSGLACPLFAIAVALTLAQPVGAQPPAEPSPALPSNSRRPTLPAKTSWPNDIERALGSIAGSLAGLRYESARASAAQRSATTHGAAPGDPTPSAPASFANPDVHTATHGVVVEQRYSGQVHVPPPIPHGPMAGQLDPYRARADSIQESRYPLNDPSATRWADPWWQTAVPQPLGLSPQILPIDVGELVQISLVSSPYVQGLLTEPQIRRNDVVIADADFDTTTFLEGKFADTNEPIGDTLTTGFLDGRFRDETFTSAAGLRRKARNGATWEVVQRGGFQDNNSTFLIPNPQGTTRLEVNFTQPLLKNGGRAVNNVQILLARIDVQLANSEVRDELQQHLTDVTRAYWNLYQARAEWLQRTRLLTSAKKLRDILQARGQVDSLQRQILRADAAVASRRSDLVRAEARIRNTQARLRLLTGDPRLFQASEWELTPQESPFSRPLDVSLREATITALDNRPDIAQSIRLVQAASAKVGAANNQVLPTLDLILSTYVAGLDDDRSTFGAWERQFTEGRPSYAAGLLFEVPIGNRASRARLNRNRWELTRSLREFEFTTEVAFTEVEVAVRETRTAYEEMLAKKTAVDAAEREVAYLQQRWEQLPDPNESAVLLIENLLDAQERRADEEQSLVQAQVSYALSWVQLRKVMGVLLRFDRTLIPTSDQSEMPANATTVREARNLKLGVGIEKR